MSCVYTYLVLLCVEGGWTGILFLVFDLEVVENGFEVILGREACVSQKAVGLRR